MGRLERCNSRKWKRGNQSNKSHHQSGLSIRLGQLRFYMVQWLAPVSLVVGPPGWWGRRGAACGDFL